MPLYERGGSEDPPFLFTAKNKINHMAINKDSVEFTMKIFNWCMHNGIKDITKIQELCELILAGIEEKEQPKEKKDETDAYWANLRAAKGLSLRNLGKEAGIPASSVRNIERGATIPPHQVEKLKVYYGLDKK